MNTNNPQVNNLSAKIVSDENHSIVFVDLSIKNKTPVNFVVNGFHYDTYKDVSFFIPHGTENNFKKLMSEAPVVNCNVQFHGMDGKMIGHYDKNRTNNEGGGSLTSNSNNPTTMKEFCENTQFNNILVDKSQNNSYNYIMAPLSFYSAIEYDELFDKVLEQDLKNIISQTIVSEIKPKYNKDIKFFVDDRFFNVNTKFKEKFKNQWINKMESMGYKINVSNNPMLSAIQLHFGIKTPDQTINFNEHLTFESVNKLDVDFCTSSNHNLKVIPRTNGRISIQTTSSNIEDDKIITVLKGKPDTLQFLDLKVNIEEIDFNDLDDESEFKKYQDFCKSVLVNLELQDEMKDLNEESGREEKNNILLTNSEKIVQFLFCDPLKPKKVRFKDDDTINDFDFLMSDLNSFVNKQLFNNVCKLKSSTSLIKQKAEHNNYLQESALNNYLPEDDRFNYMQPRFIGRQASHGVNY